MYYVVVLYQASGRTCSPSLSCVTWTQLSCHHSQLSSIKTFRGLWNKTGLTDLTKWAIMSQIRNFGRQRYPKCYCSGFTGSVDTHTHVHGGGGEGWLWGCAKSRMVVSPLDRWKRGGWIALEIKPSEKEPLWREQMASDNKQRTNRRKPSEYECCTVERLKLMRRSSGLCLQVWKSVHENLSMCEQTCARTFAEKKKKTPEAWTPTFSVQSAKWRES